MKTVHWARVRCMSPLVGALVLLGALVGGCASPSPWDQSFLAEPPISVGSRGPGDPAGAVTIRKLPWERMTAALESLNAHAVESDIPPAEWPDQQVRQIKAELLRALQVTGEPERVEILGKSEFKTTDPLRPDFEDKQELETSARRLGATTVVWSSVLLGKADRIEQHSVSSYSTGSDWTRDERGRRRHEPFSENTTSFVPVRVQRDEVGYVAFFLR